RNGMSIYSTQNGEVISINYSFSGGNQIFIRNNDGSISGYAHTSAEGVIVGSRVYGGQRIGYSDASGWAKGKAHLHYTYRPPTHNGMPATLSTPAYNPMMQLSRAIRPPEMP
ncbi:MAG: M23 family metallopeptidase, partial [Luteimonas sp.]|nr:M23 family metallopeptidase [Luteimonas sp.]